MLGLELSLYFQSNRYEIQIIMSRQEGQTWVFFIWHRILHGKCYIILYADIRDNIIIVNSLELKNLISVPFPGSGNQLKRKSCTVITMVFYTGKFCSSLAALHS